jgi:hypothetical protein
MGLRHLRYLVAVADAGVTPSDFKLESASDRRKASARSHGAMVATAAPLSALRYRPIQLRHPVSIPRGLVSHAADPLDA